MVWIESAPCVWLPAQTAAAAAAAAANKDSGTADAQVFHKEIGNLQAANV
jgi:hypothetical protein